MGKVNIKLAIFLTPIIFGCQSHNNDEQSQKNKVKQITALTSGIRYLNEICGMENLPDENKIIKKAIEIMGSNEIDKSQHKNASLSELTEIRYKKLRSDGIDNNYKCKELSQILNIFIVKVD
ncbi:type II secretion system pilot lipoprotein GspS [Yersinia pekkanenii]|uniref:Lipoprotein n=1 Tax=Yersinia pekkanenii TaxID=1288385 RepID=A0A0T9P8U2_9GAMM|nr:type II secretion system pilot lipoprotein GspS [Yersinia pekkanenii]CNH51913.1 lipoprotein [Yersinia pekkanenii]CRY67836.1 lipoprotein [Yersinia pekkanenii]